MPAVRAARNTLFRLIAIVALAGSALALASAIDIARAGADAIADHSPFGWNDSISTPSAGVLEFTGWTSDPDNLRTNLGISGLVDGAYVAGTTTSIARPYMTANEGAGPTPGYVLDVPVPQDDANHTVCIAERNLGLGLDRLVRCVFTPLGRTPGSAEVATHSPRGHINWAAARNGSYQITGYATDPDYVSRRLELALYLDGAWAEDAVTNTIAEVSVAPAAGPRSMFQLSVPASAGAHIGCVWIVNIGPGNNTPLGCRPRDTRGESVGTGTVPTPAVNAQILAEAKKHIGQPYVWGAAGPKQFDCSGLVTYSYSKFGVSTPRVSSDQFHAALKIPASRAVAGDLVFYHDLYGDVYHVGVYLSPGQTVAAIDEAEGVDYQTIWDPATATYGSFTHT